MKKKWWKEKKYKKTKRIREEGFKCHEVGLTPDSFSFPQTWGKWQRYIFKRDWFFQTKDWISYIYIYIEGEAFQIDWIFFRLCFIYILSFLRHYVSPDNKMEFTSFPIFFFLKTRIFSEFHLYIFSKWFLSGEIEKIFSRVSNVRETNFIMKFEVNWEIK